MAFGMNKMSQLTDLSGKYRTLLKTWRRRKTTREPRKHLSRHLRDDIGYDKIACARESRKWFWQGEDKP